MNRETVSGAQLLSRLSRVQRLATVDTTLFFNGLESNSVVEISGDHSAGKTLLLSQLIVKAVLPARYEDVSIGGHDVAAVLINTDHHFQSSKLRELMEEFVRDAARNLDVETVDLIVRNSFQKLQIFDCYDIEQFHLTIRIIHDLALRDYSIGLVAVDGLDAYYWEDRCADRGTSLDSYLLKCIKSLRWHVSYYRIIAMYTRSGVERFGFERTGENRKEYKVILRKGSDSSTGGECTVVAARGANRKLIYTIGKIGIRWIDWE